MASCSCGMEDGDMRRFSVDWHRAHLEHHLTVFPNVDDGTRRNLAEFIAEAEAKVTA